ncbi:MAG: UDP-N-acetylmuramoyl-L-alanyl-D-glutamate--2,6-diaminopimelate ligase [Ignavibacteria bacterium]|nr:UDP-N-acetylmuramoyl-L-alanyl-D-glutamate--2,6-diaminopimelate ligase [Ignavibacteria bacterium]
MVTLEQIISILNPKSVLGNIKETNPIDSICYNSKNCGPNSLFFAIKGSKVDGHNFIDEAISNGAKVIVCEVFPTSIETNCNYILVDDTRKALAVASNFWFNYPTEGIKIVGVTGTNGKTTVTYLLKHIFEFIGVRSAIIGTTGTFAENYFRKLEVTTPNSFELFQIFKELKERNVHFVAMEVSSHSLDQERTFGIKFDGAIFTNLTPEHLDYHLTMENYARAKKKLFDNLPENSVAVAFSGTSYADMMLADTKAKNKIFVGRNESSDFIIRSEKVSLSGLEFELESKRKDLLFDKVLFRSPMWGRYNIENISLAVVIALHYGISFEAIQSALLAFSSVPGRMQKLELKNGALGVVDYAHTPDALEKLLRTLREIIVQSSASTRLVCVFGCGGDRDKSKRPVMGKVASLLADLVVITNDNPRSENPEKIIEEIYEGVPFDARQKVYKIPDRREAIQFAYSKSNCNDIIVVAGKGHETYQIIGDSTYYFNDFEELEKLS